MEGAVSVTDVDGGAGRQARAFEVRRCCSGGAVDPDQVGAGEGIKKAFGDDVRVTVQREPGLSVVALGVDQLVADGIEVFLGSAVLLGIWRGVVEFEAEAGVVELEQQGFAFDAFGRGKRCEQTVMDLLVINGANPALFPEEVEVISVEAAFVELVFVVREVEVRHQNRASTSWGGIGGWAAVPVWGSMP